MGARDRVLFTSRIEMFDIKSVQTNDQCLIELLEIELFDYLTVSKEMTDV